MATSLLTCIVFYVGITGCFSLPSTNNGLIQGKIVNGTDALPNEFPWMALLTDSFGVQFCGGSLISEDFVLTAAHCLVGDPEWNPPAVKVQLGVFNKSRNEPESFFVNIRRLLRHPNYVSGGVVSDIALLQLDQKVPFSDAVRPICVPSEGESFEGVTATISGWGWTEADGTGSDVLQKAEVPVLPQSECKQIFGNVITDDMVCAGGQGKNTCHNDSGGPMMYNDPKSGWVLIGVTSFGDCRQNPGVFSRVSFASPWIRENIHESSLCLR